MARFSCRGCTDRCVGCHSTCEKYIAEKLENDRLRELAQKKRNEEINLKCLGLSHKRK